MNWNENFEFTQARFVLPGLGEFNKNNPNISEERLLKAMERGAPIVFTEKGKAKYNFKEVEPTEISVKEVTQPKKAKSNKKSGS